MEILQILKFRYKKERLNFTTALRIVPGQHATAFTSTSTEVLTNLLTEGTEESRDEVLRIMFDPDE
jgi:hypothetical protein